MQWQEVPVKEEVDTLHCKDKVEADGLTDCAGASCVVFMAFMPEAAKYSA